MDEKDLGRLQVAEDIKMGTTICQIRPLSERFSTSCIWRATNHFVKNPAPTMIKTKPHFFQRLHFYVYINLSIILIVNGYFFKNIQNCKDYIQFYFLISEILITFAATRPAYSRGPSRPAGWETLL